MRAMILLGINGGLGDSDCGRLSQSAVNLETGLIDFPGPKPASRVGARCGPKPSRRSATLWQCARTRRMSPIRTWCSSRSTGRRGPRTAPIRRSRKSSGSCSARSSSAGERGSGFTPCAHVPHRCRRSQGPTRGRLRDGPRVRAHVVPLPRNDLRRAPQAPSASGRSDPRQRSADLQNRKVPNSRYGTLRRLLEKSRSRTSQSRQSLTLAPTNCVNRAQVSGCSNALTGTK